MKTIIYRDSGNIYLGEHSMQDLSYWKWYGEQKNERYMYKGYRYLGDKKDIVIVYSRRRWNNKEVERRKSNGFKGIKEYIIF